MAQKKKNQPPCSFCLNARIAGSPDLTDDNDLSFQAPPTVAALPGYRVIMSSGAGKSSRLIFERLDGRRGWKSCATYWLHYCPECGRRITEYNNDWRRKK